MKIAQLTDGSQTSCETQAELERCLALRATLPTTESARIAETLEGIAPLYEQLGRPEDQVGVLEEAVRLRRELARFDPKTNVPILVTSLERLGASLDQVHRDRDSLTTSQEAVSLALTLAETDPAACLRLQSLLHQLLPTFDKLGENEAALKAMSQCIKLLRPLADIAPIVYLPWLAASIYDLAILYRRVHSHEHAVDAAEELVGIRRQIAETDQAQLVDVANALSWLAFYQWQVDRRKDALLVSRERVAIHRGLAGKDLATHRAGLSKALRDMSSYMGKGKNGRCREAVAVTEEAVLLARELQDVSALAGALSSLAWCRCEMGQHEKAIATADEGIQITRTLVISEPATQLPQLAFYLQRLSYFWHKRGHSKEALAILQDAMSIRRTLGQDNPAGHLPHLAKILYNIGYNLHDLGRVSEAAIATEECVAIRRDLAAEHPETYSKPLVIALVNLAWHMNRLGRHGEAYGVRKEAWILCPEIRKTF